MEHLAKDALITAVADGAGITKEQARLAINATLDTIMTALRAGKGTELRGFGTFAVQQRNARKGRNPHTGEEVHVAARRVARFKPGKEMRAIK